MDFLKQCPLLICVLLTSLLIPWELLKKEDDSQKAAPTTVAKITTVATEAATTAPPANDGATPDGSETTVSGISPKRYMPTVREFPINRASSK